MSQTNLQLAAIFQQMADVAEILGSDRFRVIAFAKIARVLRDLPYDISPIGGDMEQLAEIPGIGKGSAQRIAEYFQSGKIQDHAELMKQIPPGLLELLTVPGLGPKTAALLWKQGGVESLADLKAKLDSNALGGIKGLGPKKLQNLKNNLAFAQSASRRIELGKALPMAVWFVEQLRKVPHVKQAALAGSARRGRETIGDVDLVVAAESQYAPAISEAFTQLSPVQTVVARGVTKTSILTVNQVQVDLRVVEPESFGAALLYFTGSKEHNVALRSRAIDHGYKLNEYGLYQNDDLAAGQTEEAIYNKLGLDWIAPELREDRGEIALAKAHQLPELISLQDIKAELHSHTTASDGKWSIRELAIAAAERGFHTVAITDHSKSQVIANGLDTRRLMQHVEQIRAVAAQLKDTITVLAGSEVDILPDGKLDYPNSVLKELDIVVASPHHALTQDAAKATRRLLKAIDNPWVTIIGHPTGRMINRRGGLQPDMKQIIEAAAKRGIALEINANYHRLDLRDSHARAAIEAGVKLSINTDAHGPADLDQLYFGILTARRAGATRQDVINCMDKPALLQWIKQVRG